MKLAIVTFHNSFAPNDVGGGSSAPIYFYDQMKKYFTDIDIFTLNNHIKHKSPIASNVTYTDDYSVLDNYDFVIFTAPGLTYEKYDEKNPNKYIDILNHAREFAFMCHEENDRKLYPYYKNFLSHPNMTFILFNCPTMATVTFPDYVEIAGDWEYVNYCPILPDKSVILERALHKNNKIMSTCRWTTSKRIYEYLSMTEDFLAKGIQVYAAGSHQSYWYNLKMDELPSKNYIDLGYYEPSQIPELLKDVKYHWNFLFQLRGMGQKTHQPRLEIATMEAFREGCLPVICKEFTPDWVGEDSAIRISKDNYTELPNILSSLSDEERIDRLSKFYDLVQDNIISHYKDIAEHIKEIVKVNYNVE